MTRIWVGVAATLTAALVLTGLVVLMLAGPVRDHGMMAGVAPDGNDMGRGMAGAGHMGGVERTEYDYLAQMIAHHEEAIAAAAQLSRSERPEMRELGVSITTSQTAQVAQMTGWLDRWYPDRPATDAGYVPAMRDLTGLSGDSLDHAFLTDMTGHHMMAVMASQRLLAMGSVEHEEVAGLARTIRDDQRAEIVQMHSWLHEWYDAG